MTRVVQTLDVSGAIAAEAVGGQQVLYPRRNLILLAGNGDCCWDSLCHLRSAISYCSLMLSNSNDFPEAYCK